MQRLEAFRGQCFHTSFWWPQAGLKARTLALPVCTYSFQLESLTGRNCGSASKEVTRSERGCRRLRGSGPLPERSQVCVFPEDQEVERLLIPPRSVHSPASSQHFLGGCLERNSHSPASQTSCHLQEPLAPGTGPRLGGIISAAVHTQHPSSLLVLEQTGPV